MGKIKTRSLRIGFSEGMIYGAKPLIQAGFSARKTYLEALATAASKGFAASLAIAENTSPTFEE